MFFIQSGSPDLDLCDFTYKSLDIEASGGFNSIEILLR